MLCPSWTRRSNSASSCFLSQKSEPPATLVVNGLLAAALLFIMDSSITPNVLHQTCYTKRVTPNMLHQTCYTKRVTPNVLHQTCYTKRVTPNVLHQTCYTKRVTPLIWDTLFSAYGWYSFLALGSLSRGISEMSPTIVSQESICSAEVSVGGRTTSVPPSVIEQRIPKNAGGPWLPPGWG